VTPTPTDRVQNLLKATSVRARLGYATPLTHDLADGLRGFLGPVLAATAGGETLTGSWPPWLSAS
jgi:hypothetical protein